MRQLIGCGVLWGIGLSVLLAVRRRLRGEQKLRLWTKAMWILLVTGFLAMVVASLDLREENMGKHPAISRSSQGSGKNRQELEADVNGERVIVQAEINERRYTEDELQSAMEQAVRDLDEIILGENYSLDDVDSNLKLLRQIPQTSIAVSWEVSDYKVMDNSGTLNRENLTLDGTFVELTAVLSCQGREMIYKTGVQVYRKNAGLREKLETAIREEDAKSEKEETVILPLEVEGVPVRWRKSVPGRGIWMIILGILGATVPFVKEKEEKKTWKRKRENQLLNDYPELLNQLSLLLGAGMTLQRAWIQIVGRYREKKAGGEIRFVYEEMELTCRELENGMSEIDCYERFGKRCQVQSYLKFSALLTQNARKGTKGLSELLKMEAVQAFEDRIRRGKQKGEEAGTKMMGPMFLMLAVVMAIVIVPAFLSIQI